MTKKKCKVHHNPFNFIMTVFIISEQNQIILLKLRYVGELLDILCRHQTNSDQSRVAAKIASALLATFMHLVPSSKDFLRVKV